MQLLVYILAYPFLWLISILPHRLFYRFSDLVFLLVYHVAGYRKNVVLDNLKLVFPEKSTEEIFRIRKAFYRHLCDVFLEMIKTMNLHPDTIGQRFVVTNKELLQEMEKSGSVMLLCAHYANWEWVISINNYLSSRGYAVYQKINNIYFERLINRIRKRWNTIPITQKETIKRVLRNEEDGIRAVYGLVSDQSPQVHGKPYWSQFLGVRVPIFNGAEVLARRLDLAVVYLKVTKVKRGYYTATFVPITQAGGQTPKHWITEQFLRLAEEQIRGQPEYYLWTHRRWKHMDNVPDHVI